MWSKIGLAWNNVVTSSKKKHYEIARMLMMDMF